LARWRPTQRLLEDLGFQGILAEQPLQLTDLVLHGPVLGGSDHLLLGTGGSERSLGGELAPAEELVGSHSMPAGDQADRDVGLVGLLDDGQLLGGRPVAAALRSVKDLNLGEEQSQA
jgi:hypothetical protein